MFTRILLWPLMATITIAVSFAQQTNEGAYSCAAKSSGGIFYNDQTKKWEGTSFRPLSEFTLRLKYVRTATDGDEYAATVTLLAGTMRYHALHIERNWFRSMNLVFWFVGQNFTITSSI